jgi:hypothetical protein
MFTGPVWRQYSHLTGKASIGIIPSHFHKASRFSQVTYRPRWWYIRNMGDSASFRQYLTELGRRGGQARAKALSPERRRAIAKKAAKAATKARQEKAKKKS